MTPPITVASTDLGLAHPLLRTRWAALVLKLAAVGLNVRVIEVYRSDARQQWLFGAGRTGIDCIRAGVPSAYARPNEAVVTNAWSAATSAHGWTDNGVPAACAIDCDPVGPDGKPWTPDDEWDRFVSVTEELAASCGLRHFRNAVGKITDRPHVQLLEWNDHLERLVLSPPVAA